MVWLGFEQGGDGWQCGFVVEQLGFVCCEVGKQFMLFVMCCDCFIGLQFFGLVIVGIVFVVVDVYQYLFGVYLVQGVGMWCLVFGYVKVVVVVGVLVVVVIIVQGEGQVVKVCVYLFVFFQLLVGYLVWWLYVELFYGFQKGCLYLFFQCFFVYERYEGLLFGVVYFEVIVEQLVQFGLFCFLLWCEGLYVVEQCFGMVVVEVCDGGVNFVVGEWLVSSYSVVYFILFSSSWVILLLLWILINGLEYGVKVLGWYMMFWVCNF